jgi:endonuclease YncB( thermonuclease family)
MKFLLLILLLATVLIAGCTSVSCPVPNEKYCVSDSDCMCSTSPCFLGNKEYFEKCIPDKSALGACLDACGFGPYEMEFRYICEDSQCIIATFNRTTGQRITQNTNPIQEPQNNTEPNQVSLCKGTARCFNGTVTKIVDGDTLEVDDVSIRLALIDAPEYNEVGGSEAREFALSICPIGSDALVDEDDNQTGGSYGRTVGVVYCNGNNINEELVKNGFAIIDTRFCSVSEFADEDWSGCYP